MSNSIRINLTKEGILNEIRLFQSADYEHKYTHIVLEGMSDIRFFRDKTSDTSILYESFSGKEGVLEIVNTFSSENVIGICDRDYDTDSNSGNIFFYDYSSLETMMLSSFSVFEKTCNALFPHIADVKSIYTDIFSQLRWVSAFRKVNSQQRLGVKFSIFSPHKAFNKSNRSLDISKTISLLKDANRDLFASNPDIIRRVAREVSTSTDITMDLYNTNGHDALQMFHCLCKAPGKDSVNEDVILSVLIVGFDFRTTQLYSTLCRYAIDNKLQIFA